MLRGSTSARVPERRKVQPECPCPCPNRMSKSMSKSKVQVRIRVRHLIPIYSQLPPDPKYRQFSNVIFFKCIVVNCGPGFEQQWYPTVHCCRPPVPVGHPPRVRTRRGTVGHLLYRPQPTSLRREGVYSRSSSWLELENSEEWEDDEGIGEGKVVTVGSGGAGKNA